jgi:uncharacterized protein YlxW (UPF0749 family)
MSTPLHERRGVTGPGARMLTDLLTNHLDPGYAAAARRRAQDGPQAAGPRWLRVAATAGTAVAIGVVLAIAYTQAVASAPERARTRTALVHEVEKRSARTDQLQARAEELRMQATRVRAAVLAGSAAGTAADATVRELQAATGLGTVRGPGLVVTVQDGPAPTDPVTGKPTGESDLARVQDRDLQDIVNALWASGAEAVSINDQRLATTSAIRSAGGAVLVDFRPVNSPYRISAIGDPARMPANLDGSAAARRFRGYESQYGMAFSTRTVESLQLPAAPAPDLRHIRPMPTAVPSPSGGGR